MVVGIDLGGQQGDEFQSEAVRLEREHGLTVVQLPQSHARLTVALGGAVRGDRRAPPAATAAGSISMSTSPAPVAKRPAAAGVWTSRATMHVSTLSSPWRWNRGRPARPAAC